MRAVLYVAHALRPSESEIATARVPRVIQGVEVTMGPDEEPAACAAAALRRNLDRAMAWLSWLRRSFPETTFIAPWIVDIISGADDSDEAQREAGMQGNFAVIERCDGIVLCGPRISDGMRREMEHGVSLTMTGRAGHYCAFGNEPPSFIAYDLTYLGTDPPTTHPRGDRSFTQVFGVCR